MKKKNNTIVPVNTVPYHPAHHHLFKVLVFSFFLLAVAIVFFYQSRHFVTIKKTIATESLPAIQTDEYELGVLEAKVTEIERVVAKRTGQ